MGSHLWLVASGKAATVVYLELLPLIDESTDTLVIAEITANSFGTYIARRNDKVAGLIGNARR